MLVLGSCNPRSVVSIHFWARRARQDEWRRPVARLPRENDLDLAERFVWRVADNQFFGETHHNASLPFLNRLLYDRLDLFGVAPGAIVIERAKKHLGMQGPGFAWTR